jgi:hypothetical protein
MNEMMTIDEMWDRFRGEWVYLEDPESHPTLGVQRGRVVAHSKDRDEIYGIAATRRPSCFAVKFFGTIPEGMEVVL